MTFPLELIGLSLALIEVRFPEVAANLTRQIERLSAPMQELRTGQSGSESLIERSLGALLARLIKTGFYILTAIYSVKLIYRLFSRTAELDWLVGMLFSYVIWAIIMTVALAINGVRALFLRVSIAIADDVKRALKT